MSVNVTLVIIGVVLCVIGLAKLGSPQSGGLSLRNFGISFGGKSNQSISLALAVHAA
jgi:hypothetical protein